MGIFSSGSYIENIQETFKDPSEISDMIIADEVSHLSEEKIHEFCKEGGVGEALVEAGHMRKKTIVRLNKKDDLSRRTTQMALQIAKEKGDPLWDKLAANRVKERDLLGKIEAKYGLKAEKLAKEAQNNYLHGNKAPLPKSFQRAGGAERIGE